MRAAFGALLIVAVAVSGAAQARTLVVHANGYTFDAKGALQRFAGLLIDDDGKVAATFRKGAREPKLEAGDYRLDAEGKTLIPGLIDPDIDLLPHALALLRGGTEGDDRGAAPAAATPAERERALTLALRRFAALGVTSVHDMATTADDWALYRAFGDDGRLTLRITAYASGMEAMERIAPLRPTPWLYGDRLKLQGIALGADGAASAEEGKPSPEDARQKNLFSRANFFGYQLAVRATDAAAMPGVLESLDSIRPAYGDKFRNRIERLPALAGDDLRHLGALRLVATLAPGAARPCLAARLMREKIVTAYAGAATGALSPSDGGGTDDSDGAACEPPKKDRPPWFRGATIAAAFAGHGEERVGRLAPGLWADFLLLDDDPFAAGAEEGAPLAVAETWLGGRRLYQREASSSR